MLNKVSLLLSNEFFILLNFFIDFIFIKFFIVKLRGIFHIHSCYSFDTTLSISTIINFAKSIGVDFIAITDHNTIKGAIEAKKLANNSPYIIIGAEYETDIGDIMGLFIKKEIKKRNAIEVIEEIKNQGGIVVLPHPYREHKKLEPALIEKCDVIEAFNSRCSKSQNEKALELAKKFNKPIIIGSDAHFLSEISLTMIEFNSPNIKETILTGDYKIIKKENSKFYYRIMTGFINFYKTKNTKLPIKWIKKILTKKFY